MSVYIKGEEFHKPTACAPCKLRNWCQLWRQVVLPAHIVHPECPISEVPEHGRLIEESKVLDIVFEWCPDDDGTVGKVGDLREMLDEIEALPTIIPADENSPVYESIKRGLEQAINGETREEETE